MSRKSKDWDDTENLYIEGDNLEVLRVLQESYLGKIKMIYIDLPYNTGHDFIYPDSFIMDNEEYSEGTGYFDEDGNVNYSRENTSRAGKDLNENTSEGDKLDIGFRVLKLDESNMTDVYYSPAEYSQNLISMLESNVKSDRTDKDLLFGCLPEWALLLSMPYSSEKIEGYTIHNYNADDMTACFEENIPNFVIKAIAKQQPLRTVFRDSSFVGSSSKINVSEIFKLLAPDTTVKII